MRIFLLSLLLILLGFSGYSQIQEDTTIVVIPHIKSGIIEFNSPEKINSVEIRSVLDEVVFNQKIYNNQKYVNANSITRSCYYIVFTTFTGQKKIQKLFFSEEASAAPE
jgi:hypothetical protein